MYAFFHLWSHCSPYVSFLHPQYSKPSALYALGGDWWMVGGNVGFAFIFLGENSLKMCWARVRRQERKKPSKPNETNQILLVTITPVVKLRATLRTSSARYKHIWAAFIGYGLGGNEKSDNKYDLLLCRQCQQNNQPTKCTPCQSNNIRSGDPFASVRLRVKSIARMSVFTFDLIYFVSGRTRLMWWARQNNHN